MKKAILKITSVISAIIILFSLIIVPANAASYPLIMDNYFRYSVVEGDSVVLGFTIFPEYKNEKYHIELYDDYGVLVAEASDSYYNTSEMPRNLNITIDTRDLKLTSGEYTIKYYMEFYTFSDWHYAPNSYTSYLTIVKNTCSGKHSFDGGDVIIESTCSKEGKIKYTCAKCSYFKYEETLGEHTWDDGKVITPVTCTTDGETFYTCTSCGETKTEIVKAGHKWDNGKIINEATYLKEGSKEYKCLVCSEIRVEKIPVKEFKDVIATKWYKQYIDYVAEYGIFKGITDTTFEPNTSLTRGMFVTVLSRISGADINNDVTTKFKDVAKGKWYAGAVKWANDNGIVNGLSETQFGTNENITREQMCTMLVRFADFAKITLKSENAKATFADDSAISGWAKDAVYACQMANIVNGKGANKFEPKGNATRAEASKILSVFHQDYM